jgi:SpoVK/Ycf46/Vps4 family AAA+-type ATPase
MLSLIDSIFSWRDNYYIKLEKVFYSSNSLKMFIYDSGVNLSMNIEIELGDKLCITVTDKYWLMDQYFIENIINKMLYKIDSLVDSEESLTELLKNVWVMVIESSEENNDNSLEALYKQEGFLWYEKQKEKIEKSIIFPWIHKEKYLESQRKDFSNIKNLIPNAVLFEWPPWNGKTTEAKIIWKYLWYPFIYIPISTLVSKWYGESEGKLNYIFDLVWNIADEKWGAVIMIDEIDEIWTNRDDSYEATARVTWVLLKKLDSIEKVDNILLIWATNRKNVLDPALLSRFSNQIFFDNPDRETIKGIIQYYLPSLWDMPEDMYNSLEWKSGRYITSLCTEYSRSYLYKVEKEKVEKDKINQEELFKSLLIEEDKQNKK